MSGVVSTVPCSGCLVTRTLTSSFAAARADWQVYELHALERSCEFLG